MSEAFDEQIRTAFPKATDAPVLRAISMGVSLADDARRNNPWLMTAIGDDQRGSLRRAAVMWQFQQDCRTGNLPFQAEEIANTTGSSHLLKIQSRDFDVHIVRTETAGGFPKDAPIRQDMRLCNEPDLFRDGKIVPINKIREIIQRFYGWLSFNADAIGNLTHVCWCMPEAGRKRFLGHVNILREASRDTLHDDYTPPPPDLSGNIKFKSEIIEQIMDTKNDKKI